MFRANQPILRAPSNLILLIPEETKLEIASWGGVWFGGCLDRAAAAYERGRAIRVGNRDKPSAP